MPTGFVTIEKPGDKYHGMQGTIAMIYLATEAMKQNGRPYDLLLLKLTAGRVVRVPSTYVPAYDATAH